MTERVLHDKSLVYGVADQVRHDSSVVRHDRWGVRHYRSVYDMTDWVYAITCQM